MHLRPLPWMLFFSIATAFEAGCNGTQNAPSMPPLALVAPSGSGLGPVSSGGAMACKALNTSGLAPTNVCSASSATPVTITRVGSPTGTDLVIANNTSYPNSAVYVYAIGGGQYLQANGTMAPMGASAIPPLPLASSGITVFPLPFMPSARIYFSLNAPLQITNGVEPGVGANVSQIYDFVELNYDQTGFFINTTQVEMFGLPSTIQVDSAQGSQIVGLPDGTRSTIFSAVRADPQLSSLIVSNGGTDLRILAPWEGIVNGVLSPTYLDAYINQVWSYYQTHTLTLQAAGGTWSGNVSNGSFVFTQAGQTLSIPQPTSLQALGCQAPFVGPLGPTLCAGLNRGTLLDGAPQPDYNTANFYKTQPTNLYSEIFHQYNIKGLAYGFAYDDAGDCCSSVLSAVNPTTVTLTLSSF